MVSNHLMRVPGVAVDLSGQMNNSVTNQTQKLGISFCSMGLFQYCRRLLNLFEFRPVESIEMDFLCVLINKKSFVDRHFKENSFCIVLARIYQKTYFSTNVSCLFPYELWWLVLLNFMLSLI